MKYVCVHNDDFISNLQHLKLDILNIIINLVMFIVFYGIVVIRRFRIGNSATSKLIILLFQIMLAIEDFDEYH